MTLPALPDLPRFDIPPRCDQSGAAMTLDQYQDWLEENVRDLQEKGLYREYRDLQKRTPVNARFTL